MNHATDMGWMIDASHNVKDPLEDLLQSVEAIMITYAQALLVDRKKLTEAQLNNDVVTAQEILQQAFRTDVRALVAAARLKSGGALNPLAFYRQNDIRAGLIKQRGSKAIATGL
jgi:L-rhamnose isomerase / sugar isomerase